MASQTVALEIFYGGSWHDVVVDDKVFHEAPIAIQRGQGDEGSAPRPAQLTARIDNHTDKYRTTNPTSPLYGLAARNTPTRVKIGGSIRGAAEASVWACDETDDFNNAAGRGKAWTDLQAGGLLQRINQWDTLVSSTMVKGMLSFGAHAVGVWPLEDQSTATILSELSGVASIGQFTDCTLGDAETPAGSARSVKLGTTGHMFGTCGRSSASGWQISFAFKLAALPGSATAQELFTWYDSTGRRWTFEVNNVNYGWSIYANDGSLITNGASAYGAASPNQWIRVKMKATVSGGTITYEPSWYPEGAASELGVSGTFAGTSTGYLTRWGVTAGTYNTGGWYTGVFGIDDATVPIFNLGVLQDFNGHAGETTGARFTRLMGQHNLPFTVLGTSSKSAKMGGQSEATLAELLREIKDTEDGLIFDDIDAIALVFMLRNARYNQTPTLALNITDLPARPREVLDDTPRNVVTAAQRGGGQETAVDSTGPLGTQPPPAGLGEQKQTVNVNVFDETNDLPQQANWWLRRGTVNLPRYPEVTLNLTAAPAPLLAAVNATDVGNVITIAGYRENLIRLHVLGWVETVTTHTRSISYVCAPDQQFATGVYDSSTSRWDLATSTLLIGLNPGDVLAPMTVADKAEYWSSTSVPYDLMISGQQNRVLGMSKPGSIAVVDGTFETGSTGTWAGTGGTLAATAAQAHRGAYSALLTVSGSPVNALMRDTTTCPAAPGQIIYTEMWVRCSVARNVLAVIDFYNGATYLTSQITTVAVLANTWTLISTTGTAPASTTRVAYGPTMDASPANGTLLYTDDLEIIRTDVNSGRQLATLQRGTNAIPFSKTLPAGAQVHAATPGRWGL